MVVVRKMVNDRLVLQSFVLGVVIWGWGSPLNIEFAAALLSTVSSLNQHRKKQ